MSQRQQLTDSQHRTIESFIERVRLFFNPITHEGFQECVLVELERSGFQTEAQYVRNHPESIFHNKVSTNES